MNLAEKLEVARALEALGVDVIEAGFPIASPGDFEAVQAIAARESTRADHLRPGALHYERHRPRRGGGQAGRRPPRIHVFLATSAIHREFKLQHGQGRDRQAGRREAWRAPSALMRRHRVLPEDAARTELDFLAEVVEAAIDAGATHGQHPRHRRLRHPERVRRPDHATCASTCATSTGVVISVHCHDDLGLAVANILAAVRGRRAAGRVHDQRHRRARGQLRARRDRHGAARAQGPLRRLHDRHRHASTSTAPRAWCSRSPACRAAQQGDRRPQRLRPRVGHPPGRHAQEPRVPTRS